jgi:hypothetical protein
MEAVSGMRMTGAVHQYSVCKGRLGPSAVNLVILEPNRLNYTV